MKRLLHVVAGTLAGATLLSLVVLSTWIAVADRSVRREAERALARAPDEWVPALERWKLDPAIRDLGLAPTSPGNAAEVIWPANARNRPWPCARFFGQKADGPTWERDTEAWHEAARCPEVDELVGAAGMDSFDRISALATTDNPRDVLSPPPAHFTWLRYGMAALAARGRAHAEADSPDAAEQDFRSLVSLGLLLWDQSPSVSGLEMGHIALGFGLSHLAWLYESRGRRAESRRVRELAASPPPRETCRSVINQGMSRSFASLDAASLAGTLAADAGLPLALRLAALRTFRWGSGMRPAELLLGTSPHRRSRAELAARQAGFSEQWPHLDGVSKDRWRVRMAMLRLHLAGSI